MSLTNRIICIIIIGIQIFSTVSGYSYSRKLVRENIKENQDSIAELIKEKERYAAENSGITDVTTFDSHSDFFGSSYVIEKRSRVRGRIGNRIITSDLSNSTLVRNMSDSDMDPKKIAIHTVSPERQSQAEKKFGSSVKNAGEGKSNQVITFEFGIPGNHLIFSKPVLLSIDAGNIPDNSWVNLLVLHTGDTDYNTSGLMTDPNGECLPDGTASNPASRAKVINSKVVFYTCGASTFSLGYVPTRDLPNSSVLTLATYTTDDNIIIGGTFNSISGVTMSSVARVSKEGILDTTFINPDINNTVYATAIQSDGKILIGGTFTLVGGIGRTYLARLNVDGSLDATFNVPIVGSEVRAIEIARDGDIIIGGTFSDVGGKAKSNVARIKSTGGIVNGFSADTDGTVHTIAIQSDDKIIIGGEFVTLNGNTKTRIARVLDNNGNIDNTFDPILGGSVSVRDIEIQANGGVVFGGEFSLVGTGAVHNIARVSSGGILDITFNPSPNGIVRTILIESNGNIIFGGDFTLVGGFTTRNRIARYSSSGALDITLNPNANNSVYALGKDSSFNLLVGGLFTTMSSKSTPYFAWIGLYEDAIAPNINSVSLLSGSLLPIGNLTITTTYSDAGIGVDSANINMVLQRWDGTIWGPNIASAYLAAIPDITTGTGVFTLSGISYGKYRLRMQVSDLAGNMNFIERTFYVDAIEWSANQSTIDIGDVMGNIQKNSSSGELIITVKTVGAPFSLTLSGTGMNSPDAMIPHWTGVEGVGYEKYNGAYSGTLSSFLGGALIIDQPKSINTNGDKNTYTYRVQFGVKVGVEQSAGNYTAPISLQIVTVY